MALPYVILSEAKDPYDDAFHSTHHRDSER
jgi:hypothetical protein